jgi:hypothetical protein
MEETRTIQTFVGDTSQETIYTLDSTNDKVQPLISARNI